MTAGLALYANLAWALWALGVPIEIGTVKDGRMAEHYWLGPVTLFYAVLLHDVKLETGARMKRAIPIRNVHM